MEDLSSFHYLVAWLPRSYLELQEMDDKDKSRPSTFRRDFLQVSIQRFPHRVWCKARGRRCWLIAQAAIVPPVCISLSRRFAHVREPPDKYPEASTMEIESIKSMQVLMPRVDSCIGTSSVTSDPHPTRFEV
jgi:hypothetical protein